MAETVEQYVNRILGNVEGKDPLKVQKNTAKKIEKDYGYLWDDVREYVRENPGVALALSAAAGFVLGFLLRGDDD